MTRAILILRERIRDGLTAQATMTLLSAKHDNSTAISVLNEVLREIDPEAAYNLAYNGDTEVTVVS